MNSTFVAWFVVSFVLNVVTTGLVIGIASRMSETIKALGFVQNDVAWCRQFISISEQRLGTIEHQEETLLELLKQIVDTDEAFERDVDLIKKETSRASYLMRDYSLGTNDLILDQFKKFDAKNNVVKKTPEQISEENKEAYLRESELMTEYFLQKYGIRE